MELFRELLSVPGARIIIGLAIIAVLVVVLVYVVQRFRGMALGNEETSLLDHLDDFRRMRDEGYIEDKDLKRLKNELSQRVQEQRIEELNPASSVGSDKSSVDSLGETSRQHSDSPHSDSPEGGNSNSSHANSRRPEVDPELRRRLEEARREMGEERTEGDRASEGSDATSSDEGEDSSDQ